MFARFYPHIMIKDVFELTAQDLEDRGIKGVIFDIDNTLVTHDTPAPPREILSYFKELENNGIKISIVSNNHKARVEGFCKELGYPYIARAWKPFKKNLMRIESILGLSSKEICLVGDQIFTDIYGARRMGYLAVMVTAVGENETKLVAIKRVFEQLVIREYHKRAGKGKK